MIYLLPIGRDKARMPGGIGVGVRALGTKRECPVPPQILEMVVHTGSYLQTNGRQLSKSWRETGSKCVNLVNHVVFKNLADNTRFSFHCGIVSDLPVGSRRCPMNRC